MADVTNPPSAFFKQVVCKSRRRIHRSQVADFRADIRFFTVNVRDGVNRLTRSTSECERCLDVHGAELRDT